jgi:hypothetical protein
MRNLKHVLLFGLAGLALCIGGPADAQSKNPCADDLARFCRDVKPGGGRLVKCLKEHEKDLSPECKASIEAARAKAKEAHDACADDVQKFCKDVKPGKGQIVKCLKENEKQLSPECHDELKRGGKKTQ